MHTGLPVSMMGMTMVRSLDYRRASGLAAVLLGTTILAGQPAWGQAAAPAEAPSAAAAVTAPAAEPEVTPIKSITVVGAQRLEPDTAPGSIFRHSARELLALSAWRANDTSATRQWLDMIALDAETPPTVRQRAEALQALLPPVAKS